MMVRKETGSHPAGLLWKTLGILGGMTYATCAEQTMSVVVRAVNLGE
jgi:hypothetical protein